MKLIKFFLILILIFTFFKNFEFKNENVYSKDYSEIGNGIWAHISTFSNLNDEEIISIIKFLINRDIKNIFFLAKYVDGELLYKKYKDTFSKVVLLFKNYGLNVHCYIPIAYDPNFLKENPQEASFLSPNDKSYDPYRDPELKVVSLSSVKYLNYIKNIIKELIYDFDIDGIQLDYIRYPNINYGYEENFKKNFISKGGNWDRLLNLFRNGENLFELYDKKDKDVILLGETRSEIVTNFVGEIKSFISSISSNILFSVTLIQSASSFLSYKDGTIDSYPYGFLHFGQNYSEISNFCDFVSPLAYHKNYNKSVDWIREIIINTKKRVNSKILCGIGVNDTNENIEKAIKICKEEGVNFNLFRLGTFIPLNIDLDSTEKSNYTLKLSPLLKFYEYKVNSDFFDLKINRINLVKKVKLDSTLNFYSEKSYLDFYINGKDPVIASKQILETLTTIRMKIGENYIYVEGEKKLIDAPTFLNNGRTMVPVRFVAENFGYDVFWNSGEVILRNNNIEIRLYVGKNIIVINNKEIKIDSSLILKNGRVFLPIRFLGEALNLIVYWDGLRREVTLEGRVDNKLNKIFIGLNYNDNFLKILNLNTTKSIYFKNLNSIEEILLREDEFLLRGLDVLVDYNEKNLNKNSLIINKFIIMSDKGPYVIESNKYYKIIDLRKNFSLKNFVLERFNEKNNYYILIDDYTLTKVLKEYIEKDQLFLGFILLENS